MSVMSVAARAAVRQALINRPLTLSPLSVQTRCLSLSAPSMVNTDLRNIGRDPKLQSRLDVNNNNNTDQQARKTSSKTESKDVSGQSTDYRSKQGECSSNEKLWRWIPNVAEKSQSAETSKKARASSSDAMSDQDRLSVTLKEDDPCYAERKIHPDSAPDAQHKSSEDAALSPEYQKLRSQIDFANNPAPKRLTSLKETVQDELQAAKEQFEEVKDNMKETVKDLPDKAKELEHKIEEKGAQLAHKIKSFVQRDRK